MYRRKKSLPEQERQIPEKNKKICVQKDRCFWQTDFLFGEGKQDADVLGNTASCFCVRIMPG